VFCESAKEGLFKKYLVRKSYVMSTVPLRWKARDLVRDSTGCEMSLGDGVSIFGYSEAGYTSIAVADLMSRLGIDILDVRSGGSPLLSGSATLFQVMKNLHSIAREALIKNVVTLYCTSFPRRIRAWRTTDNDRTRQIQPIVTSWSIALRAA